MNGLAKLTYPYLRVQVLTMLVRPGEYFSLSETR